MIVLGIDPGTRRMGYGIIDARGDRVRLLDCGVINAGSGPLPRRLLVIARELTRILRAKNPRHAAVEKVFYARNVPSLVTLSEGRGVALLCCAQRGVSIAEYPPATIKKAVTGNGRASKNQVHDMVCAILGIRRRIPEDAADALAMALCHAFRGDF